MAKFLVSVEWSGYSRGYSVYEVEAECAKEAEDNYYSGVQTEHEVIRDDTEKEVDEVQEVR